MNEVIKTTKFQLIELQVPATAGAGTRVPIGDQPQLRSQSGTATFIESIETYSVNALTVSPISGLPVATAADIVNGVLVLNVKGYEDLQFIPLAAINRVWADTAAFVPFVQDLFLLDDIYAVDWTKSYVQLGAAPSGAIAYLFGVRYRNSLGKQVRL